MFVGPQAPEIFKKIVMEKLRGTQMYRLDLADEAINVSKVYCISKFDSLTLNWLRRNPYKSVRYTKIRENFSLSL